MFTEKVVGIVYAYNPGNEYTKVKDAGIQWIRLGTAFPWKDEMYGTISAAYLARRSKILEAYENGMQIMAVTPGLGAYHYVHEEGRTRWVDSWPEWCGPKGSHEFLENVRRTCRWISDDLSGKVGPLWQIMNEIDIATFRGDYPEQVAADTAVASAEGIVASSPDALCGINLSHYWDEGIAMGDRVYRTGHPFRYIGDDQYFGSWQGGTVETWTDIIDLLYERYQLPVLVNEWGYSSNGALKDRPDEADVPLGWASVCQVYGWHHEVQGGHTPQVQAEYLRRGLEIFASHPRVIGSFLFCWKDAERCWHCGQVGCPAECAWGIVDANAKEKPAYWAVKEAVAQYY